MAEADKSLDVKGLTCPIPVLKAKKAMKDVPKGGTLEVVATDPGSVEDFDVFCKTTGATLVEQSNDAGVYRFVIRNSG
ncbi:MAG: sulfurtransferase TusA family protein [Filomicrobium sp.]